MGVTSRSNGIGGGENVFMSGLRDLTMKIFIQIQNQNGGWNPYSTSNNQPSAYRQASSLSRSKGKRVRLIDESGRLLDVVNP
jgi:hypothetical protein